MRLETFNLGSSSPIALNVLDSPFTVLRVDNNLTGITRYEVFNAETKDLVAFETLDLAISFVAEKLEKR